MHHNIEMCPAETVQTDPEPSGKRDRIFAWFRGLHQVAETECNRRIMRVLAAVFVTEIAAFYVAFAVILNWHPKS